MAKGIPAGNSSRPMKHSKEGAGDGKGKPGLSGSAVGTKHDVVRDHVGSPKSVKVHKGKGSY